MEDVEGMGEIMEGYSVVVESHVLKERLKLIVLIQVELFDQSTFLKNPVSTGDKGLSSASEVV